MQVSMEKTGDLGRKLTVAVPSDDIDGKVSGRLNEMRGQVRLKGFRPGKVPMNVLRQRFGQQVREEVTQQVMQSSLQDAIAEQKLRVAGVSRITPATDNADAGDFEFIAELEVFPELPEIDASTLKVEKPVVEIEESDVDQMLQTLREQRQSWKQEDRPAAAGDRLQLEFAAHVEDQRIPEEGYRKVQPVLGSGALFEAFEQALVGLEPGTEQTLELTFPDDFSDSSLAGKEARLDVKLHHVETSVLPDADDDFAKEFGVEGGLEQMRIDIRKNLEREMRAARTSRIKQSVSDLLAEEYSDFSLPASAVQQEVQQMKAQLQQQYGEQLPDLPDDQMLPGAERRVRLGFLLAEIARQQSIEIDQQRVEEKVNEVAETYENPAEIVQYYQSNAQLMDSVQNMVLEEQVIDWVLETAGAEEKPMSFQQLMDRNQ